MFRKREKSVVNFNECNIVFLKMSKDDSNLGDSKGGVIELVLKHLDQNDKRKTDSENADKKRHFILKFAKYIGSFILLLLLILILWKTNNLNSNFESLVSRILQL